ncbi:MAG TPA: cobalamin biosynthesis protein CbiX [Chromatiaceae bacterium]|nr:cobalamin biosynthesis protein CbiX [Chromatiaceae bacterium]
MKALLLVAHGSRREASNEEVRRLCERITNEDGKTFGLVEAAFLELAEPSIPEGIRQCVEAGADEVLVLPYFLSAGRHVSEDIPAIVETARLEHPRIAIRLAPYLGAADAVPDLIMRVANGGKDGDTGE